MTCTPIAQLRNGNARYEKLQRFNERRMRVKKIRTPRLAGLRLRQVCPAPQVSAAVVRERLVPSAVAKLGSHAAPHTETPRGRRAFTVGGTGYRHPTARRRGDFAAPVETTMLPPPLSHPQRGSIHTAGAEAPLRMCNKRSRRVSSRSMCGRITTRMNDVDTEGRTVSAQRYGSSMQVP